MALSTKKILSLTLASSALLSPLAQANDLNLGAYTIPASACQPASATDSDKLRLSNGSYVFRGSATGTASLLCALPLNGWQAGVSLSSQNFSDPTMNMSSYRVYYRDPNDCHTGSGVSVRLRYRNESGLSSVGSNWESWQTTQPGNFCIPGTTNNTTHEVDLSHSLRTERLYHFLVSLRRTSTGQNVAFSGIDFPFQIFVPG